ncbi:MAG: DUF4342 domain-containing protein [Trueperaceae bacterium]|nr:MAG: DUF4342 domain-containing protein [Trueperaceae bacterium]
MSNQNSHEEAKTETPQGSWNDLGSSLNALFAKLGQLIKEGNRRQFMLRSRNGKVVFRLPLTIAVIIGLLLLWSAAPLLLIAFIIALALRVQFIVTRETPPHVNGETG